MHKIAFHNFYKAFLVKNSMDIAVIPAHNEQAAIEQVVLESRKHVGTVVVVDDGSTDATPFLAKNAGALVLRHKVNLGKGAALKTGCDYAYLEGAEHIIVLDGDGQHQPEEIPRFLHQLKESDVVFGHRSGQMEMPFVLRFGNWFINTTLKKIHNVSIKDSQCGYRAFTRDAYKRIRWNAADYFMETEMIIRTGRNKLRYGQAKIKTIYTDKYKGTTVLDGAKIVFGLCTWRLWR